MFFKNLFSRKTKPEPQPEPQVRRDLVALTRALAEPALHAVKDDEPYRSHFGGNPRLPPHVPWPTSAGKPLNFIARLSLGELQQALSTPWLPSEGALLFFYDVEEQPWGGPLEPEPGFRVLHVPDGTSADFLRESPAAELPHHFIRFDQIDSLPSSQRDCIDDLNLNDAEQNAYYDLTDTHFGRQPQHQIGGFPNPVQGDDMEMECQQYVCGKAPPGYKDPAYRAAMLEAASDWKLLFQIDSDDGLNVMWGDAGMLYFWVRPVDAQVGNFDKVMAMMACS